MVEEIKVDGHWNKEFDLVSCWVGISVDVVLSNTGYESLGLRNKILEMIMKALEDSIVNMIGGYGVGGVGKTTLIKEVAMKAQQKKLFNTVVMANITRNPNIKQIQGQITEMLGMRSEEESEIVRSYYEKENTLIILDDLWYGLDLN
ncbi:disease resistance protein [Spatholobus suberectus]|nr:disease resistance protein [Spatholobus suberectus]